MLTSGTPSAFPAVLAVVLAGQARSDKARRATLRGIYHGLRASTFPAQLSVGVVYVALTAGTGLTMIEVRLMPSGGTGGPLFTFDFATEFRSPLGVCDVVIEPPELLTFESPGAYRWQMLCGGVVLDARFMMVDQVAGG